MPDLKRMTLTDCLYAGRTLDAIEKADRAIAAKMRNKGGD